MIWKGVDRKTVFILGAGATRGAFPHVRVNGKKICAPLNNDFFKVVEAFVGAQGNKGSFHERYQRIRKVFQDEFPTRGRWPIPMETAFSLLYVSKDFPEIYGRRGRRRRAGSRREIEDFLRLTFGILSAIEVEVGDDHLYTRLVSHLRPGDTILTLNYDTLLDSALIAAGWDPGTGYGLIGGTGKIVGMVPPAIPSLANIKLLKLHGSLNWYVRGTFGKLSAIFESKPTKVTVRPRTNEFSGLVRQIIPPIYGKFFAHSHWRRLWGQAYKALQQAEVLVVIGCSLADSDFHLSGMLSRAIKSRKDSHNPLRLVTAVDTSLRGRRKWLRLVKGCMIIKAECNSFAKFADLYLKTET